MKISEDIKKYRTEEEIEIAIAFLKLMKSKSHSQVKSLTLLINLISSENALISCA
ncbi:hypothetical protein ABF176_002406 [Flavobacterium psychrophilum]|nr:hypothetical protein [Flavobacterium psychrophilum]